MSYTVPSNFTVDNIHLKIAKFYIEFEHNRPFEDGQWAALEWKDLLGLRGCGLKL